MKKRNYTAVLIVMMIFGLVEMASAQATEFTYQGRLLFGDVPANGNYDFEFALFDADTGGNQLGSTFPLSAVAVNNGVFSVRIDFGDQFPGANRFLEIHVRQTGSSTYAILSPRQSISSAPYSIKSLNASNADNAANASQLGGLTPNQFVVTSDSRLSDARPPLPSSASYIQNTTSQQALSNFNISGTGAADIFNAATQYKIGGNAVLSMPGSQNLFAGIGSGQANTTGTFNTFFGTFVGHANTTGKSNSLFGNLAGVANTTGSFNSFFGDGAGSANTTANSNSFFGGGSGAKTTTGDGNSFFGTGTGTANTTGATNSFFGGNSGISNTTGFSNTFIGAAAGTSNTIGADNSFFGAGAGSNNTTGINNTVIGFLANVATGDLSFATAIGAGSTVSSSNTLVLGRAADSVVVPGNMTITGILSANLPPNSSNYIWNSNGQQSVGNFNISGTGTANILSANTQFNIGNTKVLSMFGAGNLFVGGFAGNVNSTGINNTFAGFFADGANTSGSQNTFVGNSAGNNNTTASNNTFVGSNAGQFTTTGNFNAFFGALAGAANTFGNENAFFGDEAGKSNTSGPLNSFFGYRSGLATSSGGLNSFFGGQAGSANIFGNSNSFFGSSSGSSNTTGNQNTFLGSSTGPTNTSGSQNTLIGFLADTASTGLTNASAIGSRAVVAQSNSLILGSINGVNGATADTRVGIGTTTPARHLHIFGAGDQEIAIQSSDSGGRMWTMQSSQGGVNGRFEIIDRTANVSRFAIDLNGNVGISDSTPVAKLDIAANSGQILAGDAGCNPGFTGVGFATTLSGCANYSLLGNGTDTIINRPAGGVIAFRENNATQMSIASGGLVSIATLASGGTSTLCRNVSGQISTCSTIQGEGSDTFVRAASGGVHLRTIAGDLTLSASGTVSVSGLLSVNTVPGGGNLNLCLAGTTVSLCSSSIRYKTNIDPFSAGLELIKRLRPVTFNWRSDNSRDVGLVAEDVARIDPLLVTHNSNGGVEGVKYDRIGVVLVNAVKEQQSEIESQQKQINTQKKIIEQQQSEIDEMKKLICSRNRSAALCRSRR